MLTQQCKKVMSPGGSVSAGGQTAADWSINIQALNCGSLLPVLYQWNASRTPTVISVTVELTEKGFDLNQPKVVSLS